MALGYLKIISVYSKILTEKPFWRFYNKIPSKFLHGFANEPKTSSQHRVLSETVIKLSSKQRNGEKIKINHCSTKLPLNFEKTKNGFKTFKDYKNCCVTSKRNLTTCCPLNKKLPDCPKEKCPKMPIPCCDPPARQDCRRLLDRTECCKQEAPYPSYSEKCVEEVIDKPAECKVCPWTPDTHPYFEFVDEFPHFRHPKKPKKKNRFSTLAGQLTRHFSSNANVESTSFNFDKYFLDPTLNHVKFERKKPCKKPPPQCPPKKSTCNEPKKEEPKKKKCSQCSSFDDDCILPASLSSLKLNLAKKDPCKKENEKCKKFPYPTPPPKKRKDTDSPCAPDKPKKGGDCPGKGSGCNRCLPEIGTTTLPLHLFKENKEDVNNLLLLFEAEDFPGGNASYVLKPCKGDNSDNTCPHTREPSKNCPKESLILPKRRKVKRPPLCSEDPTKKKK